MQISIRAPLAGSDFKVAVAVHAVVLFQSALPLRGATARAWVADNPDAWISIRAPLAGSDAGDTKAERQENLFQSALPLRGATSKAMQTKRKRTYFNPRSPCGERRDTTRCATRAEYFNPRSPCGERHAKASGDKPVKEFQSALPLRGATLSGSRETAVSA